jgi:D-glycero-D-manno-heptose 1,7-bisphosphate phosphatase
MVRAVFLDRDGTIIEDSGYVGEIGRVKFLPRVGAAIKLLNENKFKVIITTNQAGVARGYFDEAAVRRVNSYVREKLAEEGAFVDRVYYCPHHVEGVIEEYRRECSCRKPNTGMIEMAVRDLGVDVGASFAIGDKESDVEAGRRAGCRTILLAGAGRGVPVSADYIAPDLYRAVKWLIKLDWREVGSHGKG